MSLVVPCCRSQITEADNRFIAQALTTSEKEHSALLSLLAEPRLRDDLLDEPAVLRQVLESPQTLNLSSACYFYIVTRHWMSRHGMGDRDAADYIASVLVAFTQSLALPHNGSRKSPFPRVVDMLQLLEHLPERKRFESQAWMGNMMLVLTGVFPKHIEHRRERFAAPALDYYEAAGRSQYQAAGQCALARKLHLDRIFSQLSEEFGQVRCVLNELSESAFTFAPLPEWN